MHRESTHNNVTKVVECGCAGFAVDWVSDRIFYAPCSEGANATISVVDLDGRNDTPLLGDWDGRYIERIEVDPYQG